MSAAKKKKKRPRGPGGRFAPIKRSGGRGGEGSDNDDSEMMWVGRSGEMREEASLESDIDVIEVRRVGGPR